jgi:citrate lyase subunit beta/citryl-CoA lyase
MNPNKKRLRRTMMFLNAQKPGLIKDPYIYKPDSIMLDLEDAVAENQKDAARFSLYHALKTINYRGCERVVRINGLDTPYWKEDIRCAVAGGCDAIRIPKTESAQDVKVVEAEVVQAEKDFGREEGSVLIMAAIESARGVMRALDICESSERLFGIALSGYPCLEFLTKCYVQERLHHRNWNRAHGSKTEHGDRSTSSWCTVL